MNRKYNLRLDLQFRCNNSVMKFRQSDNKTSDFFMRITSAGELFDIDNAIVILAVIKPNQTAQSQFLEVKEGKVYADLNSNMKDQVGIYKAQALLIYEDERVSTDVIEYEVLEDNILNQLQANVSTTEEFAMLQQMLSRLSIVENSENLRVENENSRVEAEKLREQAIEKIKNDATKLITDTKKEIAEYKNAKDTAINDDLVKYKEATNQAIETYKSNKDTEINNNLKEYKSSTTDDIEEFKNAKSQELDNFKNTKNTELDNYKKEKDLAINKYVEDKNLEINNNVTSATNTLKSDIDSYKTSKDEEIDLYKSNKDTLINNKIKEVEAAKQNIVSTANNKISELDQAKTNMQNDVNSKIEEADNRILELQGFESQLAQIENKDIEQDTRLKDVENKNKIQDVYLSGLFNENKDGRLKSEGEGNSLKLEGSKAGLVEIEKVVGNTFVNYYTFKTKDDFFSIASNVVINEHNLKFTANGRYQNAMLKPISTLKTSTEYTVVVNVLKNTLNSHMIISRVASDTQLSINAEIEPNYIGIKTYKVTSNSDFTNCTRALVTFLMNTATEGEIELNIMILEGDYTNKPIPSELFEGLQSSFEENLVTQEMVNEGLESEENLGKYKVPIKVVGKNLAPTSSYTQTLQDIGFVSTPILGSKKSIPSNSKYISYSYEYEILEINVPQQKFISNLAGSTNKGDGATFDINNTVITSSIYVGSKGIVSVKNLTHTRGYGIADIRFLRFTDTSVICKYKITNFILCVSDSPIVEDLIYEDYFERTANVYLNSPLLESDEIVMYNGELCHYHKGLIDIWTGDESWGLGTTFEGNKFATSIKPYNESIDVLVGANTLKIEVCDKLKIDNPYMDNLNCVWIYRGSENGNVERRLALDGTQTTVDDYKNWLKENNLKIYYPLQNPYYEVIQADKLLLECANDSTLSVDTVVPVKSVSASYKGNVPSVYAIEETGITNTEDISVTQTAVDFLLMSSMGEVMMMSFNENTRGGNNMGAYFASRIMKKALKYEDVIRKYPEFKDDIDFILRSEGYEYLIVEVQ